MRFFSALWMVACLAGCGGGAPSGDGGAPARDGGPRAGGGLVVDTSAPTWPAGSALVATEVRARQLSVTWTAARDDVGVTGYRFFRDGTLLGQVTPEARSFDLLGLTPATTYGLQVQAGDAAGNWSTDGPSASLKTNAADRIVLPA